ncbi:DUF2971 domain-containing protein [Kytococcus sedentarius]|uniref:DUF2971 domain-containing protein n=1 Tax=Kytococcus sedentarius TaxID=1276 RepID=UPI00195051A0|nr:DUF2971 domain-containing protein [Kytococcus sedentarius]QRO87202.1 DUF2971 domain-containing protein [Kytococcus sedentarius]
MTEMFDPDGTLDLHLPPIIDRDEAEERADRAGAPSHEPVITDPEGTDAGAADETSEEPSEEGHWLPLPQPPHPSVERVWHYTNAAGVIGLITSSQVWATSVGSLNDTAEFAHGIGVLEEQLALVLQSRHVHPVQKAFMQNAVDLARASIDVSPLYVFCASEEPDSLSQWRGYGGEVSYAVGLDVDGEIMAVVDEAREPQPLGPRGPWPRWGKVLYDSEEQRSLMLRGLSFCAATTPAPGSVEARPGLSVHQASGVLIGLSIYCKHEAFRDEREVRLVTTVPDETSAVRFRASRFGVTPYVRLAQPPACDSWSSAWWTVPEHPRLSIGGVYVGPTPHSETAAQGVRLLLESHDYRGVPVEVSTVPFR